MDEKIKTLVQKAKELTLSLLKKVNKEKKETSSSAEETEINTEGAEEEATIPNEKTTPLQKFNLTPEKKTLIIRIILIIVLAGVGGSILYEQHMGEGGKKSEERGRELIEAESTTNDPRAKEMEEKLKAKKAEMEARKQEAQTNEEKNKEEIDQPIPTTEEKTDVPAEEESKITEPPPPTALEEPTPVQTEEIPEVTPLPEEASPTPILTTPTIEVTEPEVSNVSLGEDPTTSMTPTPITPPPVVNLEEIQKTLEKTVVTPPPTARAEAAPPDYSNHGRGLVYNCREKHWACVNRMAYFQCQDNMLWAQEQAQKADCVTKQIYATDEDCHRAEQSEINAITEIKECL